MLFASLFGFVRLDVITDEMMSTATRATVLCSTGFEGRPTVQNQTAGGGDTFKTLNFRTSKVQIFKFQDFYETVENFAADKVVKSLAHWHTTRQRTFSLF